jgi:NAD(P)H dehydrogenase (quinone)
MSPRVAIVYHSAFGHTLAIAERIAKGAGAGASLHDVETLPPPGPGYAYDAAWDALEEADAIVFGCPTYMGSVSAPFKAFMDATSGVWFRQAWRDKLAAGFTCAGGLAGNKENTLQTLVTFAAQHSMIWITHGVMPSSLLPKDHPDAGADLNRMSAWLGAMAQAGSAPADETPPESDRLTAERFGERIAQVASRWAGDAI